jgi:hypothetical protein
MANFYRDFANELKEQGLSNEMVHRQRDMYQAGSGKLYHSRSSCGRLRKASAINPVTIDPASSDNINICSVCCKELPNSLQQYRRASYEVMQLLRNADAMQSATGWKALGAAERVVDEIENLKNREICNYWLTELTGAQLTARQAVERLRQASGDPAGVIDACATYMLDHEVTAKGNEFDALGSKERYSSRSYAQSRTIDRAWSAWSDAIRDGRSATARQEAHRAVEAEIGVKPVAIDQLPAITRTDLSDHASLQDWLAAEWSMSRDDAINSIVSTWEFRLQNKVKEFAELPDKIVLYSSMSDSYGRELSMTYISTFSPVRLQFRAGLLSAKVPALLHRYLADNNRRGLFGSCDAEENDTQKVLEVLSNLYDPNNGAMSDIATVMQVARVMAHPA